MKKIMTVVFAVVAAVAMAQESSAPANGVMKAKASKCVAKAVTDEGVDVDGMKSAVAAEMQNMSADEQVMFVEALNSVIEDFPGGEKEKDACFAAANDAAMQNAAPGNLARVMGAIFATVPADSLPAVTEALGKTINENAKSAGDNNQANIITAAKNVAKEVENSTAGVDSKEAKARKDAAIAVFAGIEGAPSNLADLIDINNAGTVGPQSDAAAGQTAAEGETPAQTSSEGAEVVPDVPVGLPSAASSASFMAELTSPTVSEANPSTSTALGSQYSSSSTADAGSTSQASDMVVNKESTGYYGQTNQ